MVHESADDTCIEIELGAEALAADAGSYLFHPALIDGSSVGAQRLFSRFFDGEQRLILPLAYDSFRATQPLGRACVTRIPAASLRRRNELITMDLAFFDATGSQIAELSGFACKLVRDEGAINPARRTAPADAGAGADRAATAAPAATAATAGTAAPASGDALVEQVEQVLAALMAQRIRQPVEQIDIHLGYYELGLDSARLLELVGELETRIGATLSPTLLFEYTTIAELAAYLASEYPQAWGAADAPAAVSAAQPPVETVPAPPSPVVTTTSVVEDIAIVGLAGRYPGAADAATFWQNLVEGKDCITEVPASRWPRTRLEGVRSPSGKSMSRWGGFIDDADCFDAQFFRISPWEARLIDPQQRQFLEVCWEAIEDAGYTPRNLVAARGRHQRRDVGVYVGVMHNDYALLASEQLSQGQSIPVSLNYAQIANRVSYFCNFNGPSMAVDTVCSSSLIAVHLAIESLRSGESQVAIAGGVTMSLPNDKSLVGIDPV